MSLTADQLREYLDYDPATGEFRRRERKKRIVGFVDSKGYQKIKIRGTQYAAHRLAFLYMDGCWPKKLVDHINGDRTDNRWENLRAADFSQNSRNRKLDCQNTVGLKGVIFCRNRKKYRARIRIAGVRKELGYYKSPEEAHAAYCQAAKLYHGDFANFG